MKHINRFYLVIVLTGLAMFSTVFMPNPYWNGMIIFGAFLFYLLAMAWLLDDNTQHTYNASEEKFIDWLDCLNLYHD